MKIGYLFALAPAFLAAGASAQEAQPAPQANAQAAAAISDEEVSQFAMAALIVQQIAADEAMDDQQKQAAMESVLQQTGIAPQRYSQIAQQAQSSPELQERVQVAADAHITAAQQAQQEQQAQNQ